ncbi:MAG: hypothetical protein ICV55_01495 [Coleofasciculus sp. C3-bin4]|nr:hypothetical protein [Coleofasciculus sp. C3-bin4]
MKTIETTVTVTADGKVTLQLPPDIPPGEHKIVLVIDEQSVADWKRLPLKFSAYPVGLVKESFTFRREDL